MGIIYSAKNTDLADCLDNFYQVSSKDQFATEFLKFVSPIMAELDNTVIGFPLQLLRGMYYCLSLLSLSAVICLYS